MGGNNKAGNRAAIEIAKTAAVAAGFVRILFDMKIIKYDFNILFYFIYFILLILFIFYILFVREL